MPRSALPKISVAGLALGAALTLAPPAHALGEFAEANLMAGLPSIAISAGAGVTLVHNGVLAGRGERPTTAWLATGYVFGGLDAAAGLGLLLTGLFTMGAGGSDALPMFYFGAADLAIGGLGIGLTAWSHKRPGAAGAVAPLLQRVAVLPTAVRDARGRLAPGLGLVVADF